MSMSSRTDGSRYDQEAHSLMPMSPVMAPPMTALYEEKARGRLRRIRGFSAISGFWIVLTVLLMLGNTLSLAFPAWVGSDARVGEPSLGVLNFMITFGSTRFYSTYSNLDILPSSFPEKDVPEAFIVTAVFYVIGSVLLFLTIVIGLVAMVIPKIVSLRDISMFFIAGVIQSIAIAAFIIGLLVYPLAFGQSFVQQFCGDRSSIYFAGQCSMYWSYVMGMVCTALGSFLPPLALFSMNIADDLPFICC